MSGLQNYFLLFNLHSADVVKSWKSLPQEIRLNMQVKLQNIRRSCCVARISPKTLDESVADILNIGA